MPRTLSSASRNYALSALIAQRATREAIKVRPRGTEAVARVVAAHQLTNARTSQSAVAAMLAEQEIEAAPDAALNLAGYTTDAATFAQMIEGVRDDAEFGRLVSSIVQDAGRAAESVSVATRNVYHVRHLSPPSCSRCAVLAGRVYRWSDGFKRHPGCDCSMVPTTASSPFVADVGGLVRSGLVSGLSKADRLALVDGADLSQVVNVRRTGAGLLEAGHALTRGARLTPAGIYRLSSDRDEAIRLLARNGYIT